VCGRAGSLAVPGRHRGIVGPDEGVEEAGGLRGGFQTGLLLLRQLLGEVDEFPQRYALPQCLEDLSGGAPSGSRGSTPTGAVGGAATGGGRGVVVLGGDAVAVGLGLGATAFEVGAPAGRAARASRSSCTAGATASV
jgi:hypothetical protein